jgi:hypothetical protein
MPLGLYEKETADWLKSCLSPRMTFFDIGANAGYFTLLGSSIVSEGGLAVHCGMYNQFASFLPIVKC